MKKILFLHGNAGTKNDAKPLQQFMAQSGIGIEEFLTPDLYQQRALHTLLAGKDWTVITHSWGCYFLLNQLEEIEHHLGKMIFVNPFVIPETRLSKVAQLALQVPILGQVLLQANHRKQKDEFINRMLAPASAGDIPYATELKQQINNFDLWMHAANNKIYHQKHPLQFHEAIDVPAVALIGEEDQVCDNEKQLQFLKTLVPDLTVKKFTRAGHGMIWTHLSEISKEASL